MNVSGRKLPIVSPDTQAHEAFTDPTAAVERLTALYDAATSFLRDRFVAALGEGMPESRFRAYYPEVRFTTTSFASVDSRLSFGHVAEPGAYAATITRPDLFRNYLIQQIGLLI